MKKLLISLLMGGSVATAVAQTGLDSDYGYYGNAVLPSLGNSKAQWGAIEALEDGSSLLAGYVQKAGDQTDGVVMKMLANGRPDTSFGTGGLVVVDNYPKEYIRDIVVTGYGNFLLVGNYVTPTTDKAFILSIDALGNTSVPGEIPRRLTGFGVLPTSAVKTSDGSFLIGGYAYNPNSNSRDFLIVKLNSFSTHGYVDVDLKFGKGGAVFLDVFKEDRCFQLLERPDGKILAVGYSNENNTNDFYTIVQLNPNGSVDGSFGSSSTLRLSPNSAGDRAYKATLQPDGKLVVVGTSRLSNKEVVSAIRLNVNGSYDNSFDGDGRTYLFFGPSDKAYDVRVAYDGKILIAGATRQYDYTYRNIVFRLLPNGAKDLNYGGGGMAVLISNILTDYFGSTYTVGMSLQSDGKFLTVAAQSDGTFALNRWHYSPSNSAAFTFLGVTKLPVPVYYYPNTVNTTTPECGDVVSFSPVQPTGSHVWNFGDATAVSFLASPTHVYQQAGAFNVKHWIVRSPGDSVLYQTVIAIKKYPDVGIGGDMLMPFPTPVSLFDQDYTSAEFTKYSYLWQAPSGTLQYGSNNASATFSFPNPGVHPVKLLVTDNRKGSSCQQTIETKLYIAPNYGYCDPSAGVVLGNNLVVNGDFNNSSCPATTFTTDVPWKCSLDGFFEPGRIAIVGDAAQFGSIFGTSASIPQLQGNFLLVSETVPFIYRKNIENKNIWSQYVSVQAGKKYRFTANLAELSSLLLGDYNFSEVLLLIDGQPLTLTSNDRGICGEYIASQNKTIKLSILKAEGFRVFNGSLGVDNIVFAPILQSAPNAREDVSGVTSGLMERELTVSPNPASDVLNVSYLLPAVDVGHLEILDSYTGRVVTSMPMTSTSITVPLGNLASGMYFAKLYGSDGSVLGTKKFLAVK